MNRRVLAALALLGVLALAGCLGPSSIPEGELTENATYDWETNATTTFNLSRNSYATLVNVTNETTLSVNERDALGTDSPVQVSALKFRFRNGTIVNASHANLSAQTTQDSTVISLPARNGTVAYTDTRRGKSFGSPAFVTGSYEIVLVPNTRIGIPLLSQGRPGGYSTRISDSGRQVVRWANVTRGAVNVQYYLQRDLLIFGTLFLGGLAIAVGGTVYYVRKIRRLERQREDLGDEVEFEDEDGGPPPGMG
ncbi:MAG: hypothetical protein ACI8XM_000661 [Haloarculaceae archaeon]|jgi:hypothetical protein